MPLPPSPLSWTAALGRVLFPPLQRCTLCEAVLEEPVDDGLCPCCLAQMPQIDGEICLRCGLPDVVEASRCPDCARIPPSFSLNRSLWRYQGPAQKALHFFKFQKRTHLAYIFAETMAKALCNMPRAYDIITYVPMHAQAERVRGYNQSALLAQALAERVRLPNRDLLRKKKQHTPQHLLGLEERWQNMSADLFAVHSNASVQGRVLLTDDIFTTGATAHFCSLALLEAGAEEVALLTVARSIQRDHAHNIS